MTKTRLCPICKNKLPDNANKRKKFCASEECRKIRNKEYQKTFKTRERTTHHVHKVNIHCETNPLPDYIREYKVREKIREYAFLSKHEK